MIAGSGVGRRLPGRSGRRGGGTGRLGVERLEELISGGLTLAFGAPHHAPLAVIACQRQVPVALAPGDLIQRDLKQRLQPVDGQKLIANALDDPPGGLPVDPYQPADRGPVGLRHQPRHQILEIPGEPGAVAGERDALHVHPVLGAAQPPQPGTDLQSPEAEIDMPPDRVMILHVLPRHRRVRALRTAQPLAAQRDPDHNPAGFEANLLDPDPGQIQQAKECGSDAHGRRPPVRRTQEPANLRPDPVRVRPTTPQTAARSSPPTPPLPPHPAQVSPTSMPASDDLAQPPRSTTSTGRNGISGRARLTEPLSPVQSPWSGR